MSNKVITSKFSLLRERLFGLIFFVAGLIFFLSIGAMHFYHAGNCAQGGVASTIFSSPAKDYHLVFDCPSIQTQYKQ